MGAPSSFASLAGDAARVVLSLPSASPFFSEPELSVVVAGVSGVLGGFDAPNHPQAKEAREAITARISRYLHCR